MNLKTNTQDQTLDLINSISALSETAREKWRDLVPQLSSEQRQSVSEYLQTKLTKLAQELDRQTAEYQNKQNRNALNVAENTKQQAEQTAEQKLMQEIQNS